MNAWPKRVVPFWKTIFQTIYSFILSVTYRLNYSFPIRLFSSSFSRLKKHLNHSLKGSDLSDLKTISVCNLRHESIDEKHTNIIHVLYHNREYPRNRYQYSLRSVLICCAMWCCVSTLNLFVYSIVFESICNQCFSYNLILYSRIDEAIILGKQTTRIGNLFVLATI